jgi:hypothetical protein
MVVGLMHETLYEITIPRSWGESKYRLTLHSSEYGKMIAVDVKTSRQSWYTIDTVDDNQTLFEIITHLVEKCKKD